MSHHSHRKETKAKTAQNAPEYPPAARESVTRRRIKYSKVSRARRVKHVGLINYRKLITRIVTDKTVDFTDFPNCRLVSPGPTSGPLFTRDRGPLLAAANSLSGAGSSSLELRLAICSS